MTEGSLEHGARRVPSGGGLVRRSRTGRSTPALREQGPLFFLSAGPTATSWYAAPTVAVRGRMGYLFVEAGTFWHVSIDALPAAYFAVGFAPFGI